MNIVITGGTRGIGLGLAREFLRRGHGVAISGRRAGSVHDVVGELARAHAGMRVTGLDGDMADIATARALWARARENLGSVDMWINNAGMTNVRARFDQVPDTQVAAVVGTNLTGLMNGCKVAIEGMLAQGGGRIFNMEGFGSDGLKQPGMAVYGATKCAVRYFTRSLVMEYRDTPLIIGTMSPGIVVTELLTRDLYDLRSAEFSRRRRFLNILADRVETVAPHLAEGALAATRSGADVRWMGPMQAAGRALKCLFVKRDPFAAGA
jgi:NAD(P)-dependent dehydrogenase (short-subunit alcohol dehydrogenase family)